MENFYNGIPASGRIAIGTAVVFNLSNIFIPKYTIETSEKSINNELEKLESAFLKTKDQFVALKSDLEKNYITLETGYIDANILMLEDPLIRDKVKEKLEKYHLNIEWIFNEVINDLALQLFQSNDYYFKDRSADITSFGQKVLNNLLGDQELEIPKSFEDPIVVAHTLSAPELLNFYKSNVKAVVTEIGGKTSHVAILSRDLEIPAVVGVNKITQIVQTGDMIIVDGTVGTVIHNPAKDTIHLYQYKKRDSEKYEKNLKRIEKKACCLIEGDEVLLLANLDVEEELVFVDKMTAKGIGLLRTEYIFLNRNNSPDEEEQFNIYKRITEKLNPYEVTIRIIDIGGDKKPPYMSYYEEKNPFLGWRGIRFALSHRPLLKEQIRAILRASYYGDVKIMFPMVNDFDEIQEIREVVEECKYELSTRSIPYNKKIQLGIMIETPASIILLDRIAQYVDFISVGTNDLIQYTLAIDRGNGKVASVYDPTHPAMLILLKYINDVAKEKNLEVSICGEMAGEPLYTLLLLGLGYRKLSMSPGRIPIVKYIITESSITDTQEIFSRSLEFLSKKDINQYLRKQMINRFESLEDYFRQNV